MIIRSNKMSDCNILFRRFYEKTNLSSSKKENLRVSRDAVRDKIKTFFKKTLDAQVPDFCFQGSFAIKTVVNPLDGEYDIDDGVYLQNLPNDKNKWPSTEKVHKWIVNAVENHTDETQDKTNCVRVVYKGKYHIDLPIYGEDKGETLLARKGTESWTRSDPKEFTEWFHRKLKIHGEQMRRNVQYLKAWKDYKSLEFPSIAITILVGENHISFEERDDQSLFYTIDKILYQLKNDKAVKKPVYPYENVLGKLSDNQIDRIITKLEALKSDAEKALSLSNYDTSKASELWERQFGDRFPINQSENDKAKHTAPSLIVTENEIERRRPWSNNEMV